jgi:hypothetical protein
VHSCGVDARIDRLGPQSPSSQILYRKSFKKLLTFWLMLKWQHSYRGREREKERETSIYPINTAWVLCIELRLPGFRGLIARLRHLFWTLFSYQGNGFKAYPYLTCIFGRIIRITAEFVNCQEDESVVINGLSIIRKMCPLTFKEQNLDLVPMVQMARSMKILSILFLTFAFVYMSSHMQI